jgi:uncharacterized protein YyaL (SSP411 family)
MNKKYEIKVLRVKLNKEQEKVKHLSEKLLALEKHKDQIDTNNNILNRSNMLLIEKMTKMDEHLDKVVRYARIVRAKAQKVGEDILRYQKNLAEIDFSGKI